MTEPVDLSEFSWENDDSIIIKRVDAVAVYISRLGDIVIRQQDPMGGHEDQTIIIPLERIQSVITALQQCAGSADGNP